MKTSTFTLRLFRLSENCVNAFAQAVLQRRKPCSNLRFITLSFYLVLTLAAAAYGEEIYNVNGKTVPHNVYEAAVLSREANAFVKAGNLDRAAGKLRSALRSDPNFGPAHASLGMILARQGKNDEALMHMKKALASEDVQASEYFNLASLYQSTGKIGSAIDTLKQMNALNIGEDQQTLVTQTLQMLEAEQAAESKPDVSAAKSASALDFFAYQPKGATARWTALRMPLKVYINEQSSAEGYDPHYSDLMRQAFVDWEKALPGTISLVFVNEKDNCDIDCSWSNESDEPAASNENGITAVTSRDDALSHAQIVMKAKASEGCLPFDDNLVLSTCRHEVGHALGVTWHSPNPHDVMYFSEPLLDRAREISTRDKNTVLKLYANQLSWRALYLDFMSKPGNLKIVIPIAGLLVVVLLFLSFLLSSMKRGKKKRPKI